MSEAAAAGQIEAIHELGLMYQNGSGTAANPAKALEVWRGGANRGDRECQYQVGRLCLDGPPGVPKNLGEAREALAKSHRQGYESASCDYAFMLLTAPTSPGDPAEGIKIYQQAATRGNAIAAFNLGQIYDRGQFGVPQDASQAARFYKIAADKKYPKGMVYFASFLKTGKGGVPVNLSLARQLLREAADAPEKELAAMNNYAGMCEKAEGGPADYMRAMKYYALAGQGGAVRSMEHYVRLHLDGPPDIPRNPRLAKEFAQKLDDKKVAGAADSLRRLNS
jgi:TPR repeat protein